MPSCELSFPGSVSCQAAFGVINYRMMRKFKTWLFYGVFAVALALIFAYYRFPAETVERIIVSESARLGPGIYTAIEQVEPSFPPGIEIRGLSLNRGNQPLFQAERVLVTPKLKTLLGTGKGYRFRIRAHGGAVTGSVDLSATGDQRRLQTHGWMRDLKLGDIPAVRSLSRSPLKGRLSGRWTYGNDDSDRNALKIEVQVDHLEVALSQPIGVLQQLRVETLEADAVLKNHQLQVRQVTLSGDQVEGRLSGTGVIAGSLPESRLDLAGILKPQPGILPEAGADHLQGIMNQLASKGIPIRIRGPLDRLRLTLR